MKREMNMTWGNPMRLILTFAVPLMIGNLGQQLYTIVDSIVVGRGVGVKGLAAVSLVIMGMYRFRRLGSD